MMPNVCGLAHGDSFSLQYLNQQVYYAQCTFQECKYRSKLKMLIYVKDYIRFSVNMSLVSQVPSPSTYFENTTHPYFQMTLDAGCCWGPLPDVLLLLLVARCCPTEYLKKSAPTDQKYGNEAGTPHRKKRFHRKLLKKNYLCSSEI